MSESLYQTETDVVPDIRPFDPDSLLTVLREVGEMIETQDDMARSDRFHGTHIMPGGPDHDRLYVLGAEVGEVNLAMKDIKYGIGTRREGLYDELIDVAASASAWAAAILENRP